MRAADDDTQQWQVCGTKTVRVQKGGVTEVGG